MAYSAFNDKNVLFFQGNQTKLNELITNGGASEGAFYLTNDTHRLYVGRNNGSKVIPVAVNEGVVTVQNIATLTNITGVNAGEFYYAKDENILCVYNGRTFIQINTDQNNIISSLVNTVSAESNVATIETEVIDDQGVVVQDTYQIKDSSGHTIITVSGKVIDLKADKYSLSSNVAVENNTDTATITLASENTDEDTNVKIAAGNNISIAADGTNKFKISSSYHNTTIKADPDGVAVSLEENGKVKVTITDTDGQSYSGESEAITYKVGTVGYVPGQTLPVYTKTEIDTKINGLNGMTYKGTVGASKSLPNSDVQIGDTYLVDIDDVIVVGAENSYSGEVINAGKGDILVATGNEENGIITSGLKWSYIPAGDDAEKDTNYTWNGEVASNKKILKEVNGGEVGSWALEAGAAISVSSTGSEDMKTTIGHADVAHTDANGTEENNVQSLTVVSGVEVNAQGHVVEVTKTKYNLQDTTYTLSGATEDITGGVKITDTLTASTGESLDSVTSITSDTLSMKAGTNSYSIDIKWGTF